MPFSSEKLTSPTDDVAARRSSRTRARGSDEAPSISSERMPSELIAAMAMVKRACAEANRAFTPLPPGTSPEIDLAADPDFPTSVWQTGATSQVFTTALHVAASVGVAHNLLPALDGLQTELSAKAELYRQDGQTTAARDIEDHLAQLVQAHEAIGRALPAVHRLSLHDRRSPTFGDQVTRSLTQGLGLPFANAPDPIAPLSLLDTLLTLHGALKSASLALMNIASDMRQRAQPNSSSTTQCDALTMVCCQVMGNDVSLTIGAATGQFEGRTFKPLIAHNLLQSIRLLTDATAVFTEFFVRGIEVNHEPIAHGLASSLMLVTSRTPQA